MNRIKGLLRRFSWVSPALFAALGMFPAQEVAARDLHGRFGLGFNAQFANTREAANASPSVALKYAPTRDLALEGVLGVTTTDPGSSVIAVKLFKNLFFENNLNFYGMFAGGLVTANRRSGVDLQSGFGAEFFIPGLESLGLSFEAGAELTNLSGSLVFRTLGASFLHAGMRFYF